MGPDLTSCHCCNPLKITLIHASIFFFFYLLSLVSPCLYTHAACYPQSLVFIYSVWCFRIYVLMQPVIKHLSLHNSSGSSEVANLWIIRMTAMLYISRGRVV